MAAIVPTIISSCGNMQKQKRCGEDVSSYVCLFLSGRKKSFPEFPSKHPLLRTGSHASHTPLKQLLAKDNPALFNLTMVQPMKTEKGPTYPGHTATNLNSWTKSDSINREGQGKWLLYKQPKVSPTYYLLILCFSPGFACIFFTYPNCWLSSANMIIHHKIHHTFCVTVTSEEKNILIIKILVYFNQVENFESYNKHMMYS